MSGSSTGQIAGFVVGAAIGFFTAGAGVGFLATAGSMFTGAAIGYSVGGIIDPPTVETQDTVGDQLEGIQSNMPSEGDPIHFAIGSQIRLAGNMIWAGDLIERRVEV